MGRGEDARVRDYRRRQTREAIEGYLKSIPKHAPLAIAVDSSDHELDFRAVGISSKGGEARAISLQYPELVRPLLEDPNWPKIACNVKAALLALEKLNIRGQGLAHD